jgi:membrane protein
MNSIGALFTRAADFAKQDIWRIRRTELPPGKFFFINLLRVLILSVRGFDEDKCQLRASALTFYSLVSVVPVAAMAFGIAKGFGFEKILEAQLQEKLAGHEEVINNIIRFSHSLLENTKGGLIGGIGLVVLFWAVIKVLGQIENSFNDIWGIKEERTLGRKFGDYLSVMLVAPILLIVSSGVAVFVTTQVNLIIEKIAILGAFEPLMLLLLKLFPFAIVGSLFTFLYIFMPNTNVRLSSGLIAGVIAGSIFQIAQWIYITFQVGAAKYNAIYGSFAALPLFLAWLQLSWLIVLYGAELSFAYQNVDTYEFEPDARQASHRFRTLLSLQIAHYLIKKFAAGETSPTNRQISGDLGIPIRLVNEILFDLVESGIVCETQTERQKVQGFQPARDISNLTIQNTIDAMESRGINTLPIAHDDASVALMESLESFRQAIEKLPANKPLRDI